MSHSIKGLTPDILEMMLESHHQLNPDLPIRPDIKESLDAYAFKGFRPGGFLTSVLCTDLFGAMERADSYNRATLYQICQYIFCKLPGTCWGSPEAVQEHLASFRGKIEAG